MSSTLRAGRRVIAAYGGTLAYAARATLAVRTRARLDPTLDPLPLYDHHCRGWARYICRVMGVSLGVSGLPAPARGARLVIANHRSPLDIPVLMSLFGGTMLSVARAAGLPVIGPVARGVGTIFVDPESAHSGAKAIRAMRELLRRGRTLTVFPEGGTHAGDELRPFNAGALLAARAKHLEVEVVPVGLAYQPGLEYSAQTLPQYANIAFRAAKMPIEVVIGEPYLLRGSRSEQLAKLEREVQALIHEARAAHPSSSVR